MTSENSYLASTPEKIQLLMQLDSIFVPDANKQRAEAYAEAQLRLVHYTSAEAALSIIKSKRMWMRNTNCMADYREVHHGFNIFYEFFEHKAKKEFVTQLDQCVHGVADEAITLFNQNAINRGPNGIRFNTYIASLSKHDDTENNYGRLSMWRGFGGSNTRVAIVFSIPKSAGGAEEGHLLPKVASLFSNAT